MDKSQKSIPYNIFYNIFIYMSIILQEGKGGWF